MVNNYRDVTFQLLRVALGNAGNIDYAAEQVDWQKMMNFAFRQGIAGVCFDAFCSLPKSVRPDDGLFLKWLGKLPFYRKAFRP